MAVTSKKLINNVDCCVDDSLRGIAAAFPQLVLHSKQRVLFDGSPKGKRKVAVICGGGSGHEPFSAGYVGPGMLTASVSGSVFASPPSNNILHAITCSAEQYGGVFVIVPNYTGDVLNFGLAVEMAKYQGYKVESIEVGEDIALLSHGVRSRAGNRGMCGLVVVMKVAGYLSSQGESLETIKETSQQVLNSIASIGVSLTACSLPGAGPLFDMKEDEIEFGTGVHGEAGVERIKVKTAKEVVGILLEKLTKHLELKDGVEVAVVVNNLGALSNIEQWIVTNEISQQLAAEKVQVRRIFVGSLFTSLNMSGVQISILKLTNSVFLSALDAETSAPAWPGKQYSTPITQKQFNQHTNENIPEKNIKGPILSSANCKIVKMCLLNAASAVVKNETKLNELDSGCGDGDCGTTLRHLADEIIKETNEVRLCFKNIAKLTCQLADISQSSMGGTSGAIYSLFFTTAATILETVENVEDPRSWSKAWRGGLEGIFKYSRARIGDRTLLDALEPACATFENYLKKHPQLGLEGFKLAVKSAEEGCANTNLMAATAGRASYVDKTQLKQVDAGAYGITVWLEAILQTLLENNQI